MKQKGGFVTVWFFRLSEKWLLNLISQFVKIIKILFLKQKMKPTLNTAIKTYLSEALILLMKDNEFHRIRINQICDKAGVARVSFYRNFANKEQAVIYYLQQKMIPAYLARPLNNIRDIFVAMFTSINDMGEVVDLLYANDLSHLFLAYIKDCCGAKVHFDDDEAYRTSLIMGLVFGSLDEWIVRGRKQSPDEMADKIGEHLQRIGGNWVKVSEK